MLYVGLDLSRKRLDFHLLDADGATIEVGVAPPDGDGLRGLTQRLERHGAPIRAAVESMNGARLVHDRLELAGWQVEIADAQKVKGLAPLACKTDRIDAWVLAERSRRDLVPAIWLPDPAVRGERELKGLGITVSATSVRKVLLEAGLQPAPQRSHSSWRAFLRAQAASTLACDFLTVETAFLQPIYALFFISLATRRIEYIACTAKPDGHWTAQQARNLVMQLGDEQPFRFVAGVTMNDRQLVRGSSRLAAARNTRSAGLSSARAR